MRVKEITVPPDLITEVAYLLSENQITNEIVGVTEDDELKIELQYEKNERDVIHKITDLLEDHYEDDEEEEPEEDED